MVDQPALLDRPSLLVDSSNLVANLLIAHLRIVVVHGYDAAVDEHNEILGDLVERHVLVPQAHLIAELSPALTDGRLLHHLDRSYGGGKVIIPILGRLDLSVWAEQAARVDSADAGQFEQNALDIDLRLLSSRRLQFSDPAYDVAICGQTRGVVSIGLITGELIGFVTALSRSAVLAEGLVPRVLKR